MKLVGHQLIGVLAVSLAKVLVQQDAVHDGQHGVHAVDPEKQEVLDIARGGYEPAQGKEDDEGDAHRAHVGGTGYRPWRL